MDDDGSGALLAEQVAYYRAMAPEYLQGMLDLPGGLGGAPAAGHSHANP